MKMCTTYLKKVVNKGYEVIMVVWLRTTEAYFNIFIPFFILICKHFREIFTFSSQNK